MEPMTIITTIAAGLKLVDQFSELTKKLLGKPEGEKPGVKVVSDQEKRSQFMKGEFRMSRCALRTLLSAEFDKGQT